MADAAAAIEAIGDDSGNQVADTSGFERVNQAFGLSGFQGDRLSPDLLAVLFEYHFSGGFFAG